MWPEAQTDSEIFDYLHIEFNSHEENVKLATAATNVKGLPVHQYSYDLTGELTVTPWVEPAPAPVPQTLQTPVYQTTPVYTPPPMQPTAPVAAPVYTAPVQQPTVPVSPVAPTDPRLAPAAPVYTQPIVQPTAPVAPAQPVAATTTYPAYLTAGTTQEVAQAAATAVPQPAAETPPKVQAAKKNPW